ncbi:CONSTITUTIVE EXPRESSER OF PR GENES 1, CONSTITUTIVE EXPRESSER OF PR GENES 30 [Hibiscus trionum]|uniref:CONSTITUTIVE EXPRESSER OF PR GENES 1, CONSTITUTIVE EXPRESSER OF PR GENES 30 n=1 Tax=Hibiscus trionum TaxID=183268 RepID=A0A9W7LG52_HIBTR|nr:CONSTITUTIVE EXPRESSER OF PR GENES 1, CONSTITUTIVE EXPRESSER OF PR GENES 30 [Hibiscus trionum]
MSPFLSDLIPDILCRLPVKTLLRFKCVSKSWCSLIDDPHFAKLHLDHSLKTSSNVKLFLDNCIECDDKAYAVDFDSLHNLVQFPRPFIAEITKYRSRVIGSCNGLLAVYHREGGIALWNPSTRKCRYLPPLDDDIISDHDAFPGYHYDKNTVLGFGYDETSNDFKVVQMQRSKTQNCYKVLLYSLKANSWKRIQDCPYEFPTNYNDGAYINNSLHWVGDEIGEFYGGKVIFALNLATEKYYDVPEGDTSFKMKKCGGDCPYFGYMNAGVLGGRLCVSRDYSTCPVEDHINVWVMKEYGVKESWTELFYLSRDEWLTNIFHTRAVAYSRNGDKVLLDEGGGRQPAWFNLENETGETLSIVGAPQLVSTMIYVESLVSV